MITHTPVDSGQQSGPVHLLVVGGGEIAVSIAQLSRVLDWQCRIVERVTEADDLGLDEAVVVLSHDTEIAGPALRRALDQPVRYVGALGSRSTQRLRHDWLAGHQVPSARIAEIYGPAGLDIGADRPTEIAVSIMAEIISVLRGVPCGSLSRRPGPVHHTVPG